ncbi:hypothetical protein ACVWW3_006290 [Bradyrhizobium sp. LM2.9]
MRDNPSLQDAAPDHTLRTTGQPPSGFVCVTSGDKRMVHLSRRKLLQLAAVSPSALSAAWTAPASAAAGPKTLIAVMQSDLRVTDPGFTTAIITRDHGYMVYDTLLGIDATFKVRPQMADWTVSADKLTYTFTLREGLKWHDGAPVTAEDCVASLKRWGTSVDGMARKLMDFTAGNRSRRCQNDRLQAEGALWPRTRDDRQAIGDLRLHDAQAAC